MARALTAETSSDHFVLANGQLPGNLNVDFAFCI